MNILPPQEYLTVTIAEYQQKSYWDLIPIICQVCGKNASIVKRTIHAGCKLGRKLCCSAACGSKSRKNSAVYSCTQCGKETYKNSARLAHKSRKTNHVFCSKSCSTTYNNEHKTHGYRRSKLELYIEEKLKMDFSDLDVHYNRKDTINSELDFYIPSLKLAFELNGIFHYEPIYSEKQFNQIQNNDKRKFQACIEQNIELCIIDSSKLKYFKESNAIEYYLIIKEIINKRRGGDSNSLGAV